MSITPQKATIGEWYARYNSVGSQTTKAHVIESQITDRYITRCGREMKWDNSEGMLTKTRTAEQCAQCVSDKNVFA